MTSKLLSATLIAALAVSGFSAPAMAHDPYHGHHRPDAHHPHRHHGHDGHHRHHDGFDAGDFLLGAATAATITAITRN